MSDSDPLHRFSVGLVPHGSAQDRSCRSKSHGLCCASYYVAMQGLDRDRVGTQRRRTKHKQIANPTREKIETRTARIENYTSLPLTAGTRPDRLRTMLRAPRNYPGSIALSLTL